MTIYSKIKRKFLKYLGKFTTLFSRIFCKLNGVSYGTGLRINGFLKIYNSGHVIIGDSVTINSALWANPISAASCTSLRVGGVLKIGDGTGISNTAITCQEKVTIGRNVLIGADCRIYDTDFHPLESIYRFGSRKDNEKIRHSEVIIEDGVFIGGGSIILKGSHVGKESIVGAGSVVAGNIPAGEIWAGNPARFIRKVQ